jgi:putative ABC transport system permease protein
MRQNWRRPIMACVMLSAAAASSVENDIDVEGARSRYTSQQSVASRYQSIYNDALARLRPFESALQDAERREDLAERRVGQPRGEVFTIDSNIASENSRIQTLRSELRSAESRIPSLERDISRHEADINKHEREVERAREDVRDIERRIRDEEGRGQWQCTYVDRGHEEHRGGHSATGSTREEAASAAESACLALHGQCSESGCRRVSDDLSRLRQELREAEERCTRAESSLADAESRLRSSEQELDRCEPIVRNHQSEINSAERRVYDLESRRRTAARDLDEATQDLASARRDVSDAQVGVQRERSNVARAKAEYEREEAEARRLNSYLQQVIANYEAERRNAVALGQSRGQEHSLKEASERSGPLATEQGRRVGEQQGASVGLEDAKERSFARGYVIGRREGATSQELQAFYKNGLK